MGVIFGYKKAPDVTSAGLFVAILFTKRVTGCHLNAGTTIGVAIVEKDAVNKGPIASTYIFAQALGSYLGMGISYAILGADAIIL